ncbi:MAG: DUF255 domain-containing protein [Acidobacteriota bacterium]|nr:DUF255 domain-containing protein [Acidobacteriota bacterium]
MTVTAASGQTSKSQPALKSAHNTSSLTWRPWSDSVFAEAKRNHKFVLLDLEAVWCHWCHVMDANTYSDPQVIKLLQARYITLKVDQDSRPDLSNRYEDFGWPATVVFDGDGHELVKRQGYLAPDEMASMLQAIIDDPTPGPSVQPEAKLELPSEPLLTAALRKELTGNFFNGYDTARGSWGRDQKFLDWDSVEYAMNLARLKKDARAEHMARQTLSEQLHLLDPAWGGVYQYSVGGDWNSPHFEKIMAMQAENLRIYSLAYAGWHDAQYLHAAREVHRYLRTFLMSPQGAFYTSQDADLVEGKHSAEYFALDDSQRRTLGVPRVDKNLYARENGWAINALATLYQATGDPEALRDAVRATRWVLANRSIPGGGFRHGSPVADRKGPYLGDTIAMARAFVTLYGATGDREWLTRAQSAAQFVGSNFREPSGAGFLTVKTRSSMPLSQRDENVTVARTANLLFHYTGNAQYEGLAKDAMRYLAAKPVVDHLPASSALLADLEIGSEPLHLTIVGHKDDAAARDLFNAASRYPSTYKRLEWWDTKEGRLPNPDVQYPQLKVAAAFICTSHTCSPPIFDPAKLAERTDKLLGLR